MVLAREVLLEVLRTEGVTHLFGNPGSTELPLIDALAEADDLHYVLGLQEATVVGMADGYAQATGRPAFVNLHTSAGLGNAIGNLTNAKANRAPLVVTAGQQDYRHIVTDPLLSGPLVELAGGAVKWGHEVRTAAELGTLVRRAFHDAASPPTGPVFAALPMDLLDQEVEDGAPRVSTILPAGVAAGLEELADLLCAPSAGRLGIVVGDAVAASGGVAAIVQLAEALGAPVHGAPLHGRGVFPPAHPLWQGMLNPAATALRSVLGRYDRVFLVGEQAFMVYPYTPGPAVPPDVELLHLSPDPGQLGRAWPVRLGLAGDPRRTIEALLPLVRARADT
ncbi:MAG: thiamine pyrophosphate-binding protein, partial [Acidimicrobiales bacterium]